MAGKTMAGNTAYNISAGKCMIGNTVYKITEGKTMVGGAVKTITMVNPLIDLFSGMQFVSGHTAGRDADSIATVYDTISGDSVRLNGYYFFAYNGKIVLHYFDNYNVGSETGTHEVLMSIGASISGYKDPELFYAAQGDTQAKLYVGTPYNLMVPQNRYYGATISQVTFNKSKAQVASILSGLTCSSYDGTNSDTTAYIKTETVEDNDIIMSACGSGLFVGVKDEAAIAGVREICKTGSRVVGKYSGKYYIGRMSSSTTFARSSHYGGSLVVFH